jgi:Flp pilus assembly protein TadG
MIRRSERPTLQTMNRPDGTSNERGSTMVEFAIAVTVLLTLMFGTIDFSRALYSYHFVAYAAQEATRYASVRGSSYSTACSPPTTASACYATAANVSTYVQGIVPAGVYVNGNAGSSSVAGYLAVTATWPGTVGSGITSTTCSTSNGKSNNPGCAVQVQVQYTYGFSLPFVSNLTQMHMSSTSEIEISQ